MLKYISNLDSILFEIYTKAYWDIQQDISKYSISLALNNRGHTRENINIKPGNSLIINIWKFHYMQLLFQ